MLIYLVRHGQTDWNAEGRLQGQRDISLNAIGRAQAEKNGRDLYQILMGDSAGFDFVSSPLERTRETMEILRTAMGLPPQGYRTDALLTELSFGDWEGFTLQELKAISPELVRQRKKQKWDFVPPGDKAESYETLSWRIDRWLTSIKQPTICVTHGGVIRALFKLIAHMDLQEAALSNIPQDRILKIERDQGKIAWL